MRSNEIIPASDIQAVLERMEPGKTSGNEYMTLCPSPGHDERTPSFRFNLQSGLGICFGCGFTCNIRTLARLLNVQITTSDMFDNYEFLPQIIANILTEKPPPQDNFLPDTHLQRYQFSAMEYWKSRGFSQHIIDKFQLGEDPGREFATIPIRHANGKLLGVIKRMLVPNADGEIERKYVYPKGFIKRHHMFGSWLYEETDTDVAVVVEGSVDAMAYWQVDYPSLAQLGNSISPEQQAIMVRLGVRSIVFSYDNDAAGERALLRARGFSAENYTYTPANDLTRTFSCSRVRYKPGCKDPAEASEADRINMVREAVPL